MPGGCPGGGPWHGLGPRFNGMTLWHRKVTIAGRPDRGDSAGMSESPKMPALVVAVDEAAMNATREIVAVRRWPETLRWGGCLALALGIHAAGAAVLLGWGEDPDLVANAPLIMIELAALPVAPDIKPTEIPPGPQQTQAAAGARATKAGREDRRATGRAAGRTAAGRHAAAETGGKAGRKETPAKACQRRQRAQHGRKQSRARGGADARRLLAQSRRAAELEIAIGRPARTLQALSVCKRSRATNARRGATSPSASIATAVCITRASCGARAPA